MKFWKGKRGQEYTGRNPQNPQEMDALYLRDYGVTRSDMDKRFVGNLSRDIRILEVGCNIGVQLWMLHNMGFRHLYGIDVQPIKKAGPFAFVLSPAQKIPFKDNYFDLVLTSGLLIHIPPDELLMVMGEMNRVAKDKIWGFEYGAEETTPLEYRGETGLLWKANYGGLFQAHFNLGRVYSQGYKFRDTDNYSVMYLLEKC